MKDKFWDFLVKKVSETADSKTTQLEETGDKRL